MNTITRPTVEVIPATRRFVQSGGQLNKQKDLRVAAYCRVSTGDESQQTSYTTQKGFYTSLIQSKPGWKLAGIYADEAASGTNRAHRAEFNRMIEDALLGKIDYIITKSISRFARNTVDTLNCIRQLRQSEPPVGVYFEKENIDSLDESGELILTILSALAQDESRSISDNIRWAFQKNFQAGKTHTDLNRMIGHDQGWEINEEQAEIVRYIFQRFVDGISTHKIADELNAMGKTTINGKSWRANGVMFILRNEKYVGDLEMQKTVTKDFLTHKSVENKGEAPKYYVTNHHKGIVDRTTWNKVQALLGKKIQKEKKPKKRAGISPFSNLECGEILENGKPCKSGFFRLTYTGIAKEENAKYCYPVWRCRHKDNTYYECALQQSFMEMLYRIKADVYEHGENSHIYALFKGKKSDSLAFRKASLIDKRISELESKLEEIQGRQQRAEEQSEAEIYRSLCMDIEKKIHTLKEEKKAILDENEEREELRKNFDFFLECIKNLPDKNQGGMKLMVNGVNVQGTLFRDASGKTKEKSLNSYRITPDRIAQAPDMLDFDNVVYCGCIQKGIAKGDIIEYETNFGVTLTSNGNRRTLRSFLGFKRVSADGSVEFIDKLYKVGKYNLRYLKN